MTSRGYLQAFIPALTDEVADFWLDMAGAYVSASAFGAMYTKALALRAAHMYTIASRSDTGDMVTSKSEGSLSLSFASGGAGSSLEGTVYGDMYRDMVNAFISGVCVS
jgi:hypothetical protein